MSYWAWRLIDDYGAKPMSINWAIAQVSSAYIWKEMAVWGGGLLRLRIDIKFYMARFAA
jgi:hypothetical protein